MEFVDLCIANEEDAESVFSIKGAEVTSGQIEHAQYEDVARQLTERFGFKQVAITLRESFSASHNGWSAMLYHRPAKAISPAVTTSPSWTASAAATPSRAASSSPFCAATPRKKRSTSP